MAAYNRELDLIVDLRRQNIMIDSEVFERMVEMCKALESIEKSQLFDNESKTA
jgi:ribosomal protein L13E